jgi:hypothetical protein
MLALLRSGAVRGFELVILSFLLVSYPCESLEIRAPASLMRSSLSS